MAISLSTAVYRVILLLALVFTTYMATTPDTLFDQFNLGLDLGFEISDKLLHAVTFCVLLWLADSSWPDSDINMAKVTLLLVYGAMIEIIQSYLPYRDSSFLDLVADGVGMSLYPLTIPLLRQLPILGRRWPE